MTLFDPTTWAEGRIAKLERERQFWFTAGSPPLMCPFAEHGCTFGLFDMRHQDHDLMNHIFRSHCEHCRWRRWTDETRAIMGSRVPLHPDFATQDEYDRHRFERDVLDAPETRFLSTYLGARYEVEP